MAKKLNEQNPLTLPKIRQHMLAHTSFLLAHTGQKGAPPAPLAPAAGVNAASEGGGGEGVGRKHGLEARRPRALLRWRTPLVCARQVFFGFVKIKKGLTQICLLF